MLLSTANGFVWPAERRAVVTDARQGRTWMAPLFVAAVGAYMMAFGVVKGLEDRVGGG